MTSPAQVYGDDLLSVSEGTTTWMRYADGTCVVLDLPRWTAPADAADTALLARCSGPTLDIGCGPGRLTRALVARGVPCLGVDVTPVAVDMARVGGTPVLHASVYDSVLDDTRWATVLLADGNIGIGGDPVALLSRCRDLIHPAGNVLAELDSPRERTRTVRVRVESSRGAHSDWFSWAHVSVRDINGVAAEAGLTVHDVWQAGPRSFADLRLLR